MIQNVQKVIRAREELIKDINFKSAQQLDVLKKEQIEGMNPSIDISMQM